MIAILFDDCHPVLFQFECGGMVLEEAPDKLAESFRLFLQGMGYSKYTQSPH